MVWRILVEDGKRDFLERPHHQYVIFLFYCVVRENGANHLPGSERFCSRFSFGLVESIFSFFFPYGEQHE